MSRRSGAHAELSCGISDWNAVYPVHQVRLRVSSTARVYDVDSAADWHSLVQRYRDPATHPGSDDSLRNAAGIDNGPAPTWSTVARHNDGSTSPRPLLAGIYVPRTPRRSTPLCRPGTRRALTGCGSLHHRNTTG